MKKIIIILLALLFIQFSLSSKSMEDVIKTLAEAPNNKSVKIVWSYSQVAFGGNYSIISREARYYEYVDIEKGNNKYLQIIYYPRNIAGNAILSLEKEKKTYAFNKKANFAMEIEYIPPQALFEFYIPESYSIIDEKGEKDDSSYYVKITDGKLNYEYTIDERNVPTMLVISDSETGKMFSKSSYEIFKPSKKYKNKFYEPISIAKWCSIYPYNIYEKSIRDVVYDDYSDEVFTLKFLESL